MGPDLSVHRPYMAVQAARSLVATEQNLKNCIEERKRDQRGGMSTVTITQLPVDLHILSLLTRLRTVKDCFISLRGQKTEWSQHKSVDPDA